MDVFIGVDGGGSKTLALVSDSAGRVMGRGMAGPSNFQVIGITAAYAALDEAVSAALTAAPEARPVAICIGIAGIGLARDQDIIRRWIQARYPNIPAQVVHDARLALAAGNPEGWGVALISGTGSLAYGMNRNGKEARAGGWGPILGDEGSGYALGLSGLRAVARAADGRESETALTASLLAFLGLENPADLIRYVHGEKSPRNAIADLSPLIQQAAQAGDKTAQNIVQRAGDELALAVGAVIGQLGISGPVPCALSGGVLVKGQAVLDAFRQSAQTLGLELSPLTRVEEPARGALKLARELA